MFVPEIVDCAELNASIKLMLEMVERITVTALVRIRTRMALTRVCSVTDYLEIREVNIYINNFKFIITK